MLHSLQKFASRHTHYHTYKLLHQYQSLLQFTAPIEGMVLGYGDTEREQWIQLDNNHSAFPTVQRPTAQEHNHGERGHPKDYEYQPDIRIETLLLPRDSNKTYIVLNVSLEFWKHWAALKKELILPPLFFPSPYIPTRSNTLSHTQTQLQLNT